jgi:hypothetical protein
VVYDVNDNQLSDITDAAGGTVAYEYDSANRVTPACQGHRHRNHPECRLHLLRLRSYHVNHWIPCPVLGSLRRSAQDRMLGIHISEEYAASGIRIAGAGATVLGIIIAVSSFF